MLKGHLLEGLNEAQREAVMHGEGPAMVVAGPGSGKTLTIIRRLLYLIYVKQIPAERILVITYTKEAALSMQEKFREQLKLFGLEKQLSQGYVSFGTFHSYFYQIIRSIKKYSEYQLITQQEKVKIVKSILNRTDEEVSDYAVKKLLEHISYFKNTGRLKEDWNISDECQQYEEILKSYKRMDFDDMLYLCKKELLSEVKLLHDCRERLDFILIDEYQDINPVQYELIQLLTCEKRNLFVVGDDDQAIYGFRGTDGECFRKMKRDFPEVKTIFLSINYRCAEKIVKASGKLIGQNKTRIQKEIKSGLKGECKGDIFVKENIYSSDSYKCLIEHFKEIDMQTLNREAVLFRTNASMQSFANKLVSEGIPFILRERIQSIYEHFIAKDIFDYFAASQGCKNRSLYLRIFQKYKIYNGREILKEEIVDLEEVKKQLSYGFYENQQSLNKLINLERHLLQLQRMRPQLGIRYILYGMNYEDYLITKAGNREALPEEWKEILEWLRTEAESYVEFSNWLEDTKLRKEKWEDALKFLNKQSEGIHLLTMHASKGLEFEKIYLMNLNEGTMPKMKRGEVFTQENIEEERRLFYVAFTRAKKSVELYYVIGNKENPRIRSRFIDELHLEEL